MLKFTIPGEPIPWTVPRLSRGRTYDPKEKEKAAIRFYIWHQYDGDLIEDYVGLFFIFFFSIPKSYTKKQRKWIEEGRLIPTRGDCTNYQKLYEDCLKKIVISDDRNVEIIGSKKLFADEGKVEIYVLNREEVNKSFDICKL